MCAVRRAKLNADLRHVASRIVPQLSVSRNLGTGVVHSVLLVVVVTWRSPSSHLVSHENRGKNRQSAGWARRCDMRDPVAKIRLTALE